MTNKEIINIWKTEMEHPISNNINVNIVFRNQINPTGLVFKNWKFDSDVKYKSWIHPDIGVFCIISISTLFSHN